MAKLTPTHYAIASLKSTVAELNRRIAELEATLPERKVRKKPFRLTNPKDLRGER